MRHLIIGHGQLGGAIAAHLDPRRVEVARIPWDVPIDAQRALVDQIEAFLETEERSAVLWCAGAGVVGTPEHRLRDERELLDATLDAIGRSQRGALRFFLASSAGGVYAGNGGLCTEETMPVPTSSYGHSKLLQEQMLDDWAGSVSVELLVGRISNLFGPRQNMSKPQGFISHLFAAMARQQPLVFTVPGSTIRDFVFADDIGARVASWATAPEASPGTTLKILAAERSVTLAHLTTLASRIARRSPKVLFARPAGVGQPAVLRFKSVRVAGTDHDQPPSRPLEHALHLTWSALMRRRVSSR